MDRESLMGLNNVHLKPEVNRAAAPQRNSMTYTGDREKYRIDIILFLLVNTNRGENAWLFVWMNPN